MQRYFEISNFRNIGIKEPQKLILNTTLNKEHLGNVVYIVGPNNSGKSNVLEALERFGSNKIDKTDIPDFDDSDPQPELKFVSYEGTATYAQSKSLKTQKIEEGFFFKDSSIKEINKPEPSDEAKQFAVSLIKWIWNQGYSNQPFMLTLASVINGEKYIHNPKTFILLHEFVTKKWGDSFYTQYINSNKSFVNQYLKELIIDGKNDAEVAYKSKYGYQLIPSIVRFKNTEIKQNQFIVNESDIKSSSFFANLFSLIDYNLEEVVSSYRKYNERKTRGTLESTENNINEKLEKISNRFNKLYLLENKKYRFKVILDPNQVNFQIYLDKLSLDFDKQSTGFKWFFNFYFTLASHKNLLPGDIIIMDEPATNLHVKGIEELRDFIREYAKQNKLVFVISTHSPFFIDVDYLENVRIINRINDESIINSKFSLLDKNDIDSLGQVKSALTVSRHILLDPTKKTIFVEGVTDYCYLTAFKHINKITDIVFLPIDGLNDESNPKKLKSDKDLFDAMLKIEKFPTLLVDSDIPGQEAKKRAEEKYKGRVEVISLSDVPNSSFTKIESLFDELDKTNKSFEHAVTFKDRVGVSKVSPKTKENFRKLLDYLRG